MIKLVIAVVVGFVTGVLVGRRNKKKVEAAVQQGKEVISKGKAAIKKVKK